MDKKEFEKKFKAERMANFVIVRLRNATFYADDYCFVDNSNSVDLFWKDAEIGYCKLNSIIEVF